MAAKQSAKRKATSYDRAREKFEPACLATAEGTKKAILALRALRKKSVDDERWFELCVELLDRNGRLIRRQVPGYRPELATIQLEAARGLQHIDDPRAAARLLALLALPLPHEPARPLIVFLVGHLKNSDIVPDLIDWFLKQNKLGSDSVYREMADTLIRLSNPKVVKSIRSALKSARNGYQTWAFQQALDGIQQKTPPRNSLIYRAI